MKARTPGGWLFLPARRTPGGSLQRAFAANLRDAARTRSRARAQQPRGVPQERRRSHDGRSDTCGVFYARLYLVRHAESEGNAAKIMQGAGEYPLSEHGRLQARRAARELRALDPALVVTSDLARAVDTALFAAGRVDRVDPRLRERGAGPWEGRPRADLEAAHPGALDDDALRPDGFEPAAAVVTRMRVAADELLEHGGLVVAVTHGAVLRLLDKDLGGTGARFGHLDALVLAPGLVITGRTTFLPDGDR